MGGTWFFATCLFLFFIGICSVTVACLHCYRSPFELF